MVSLPPINDAASSILNVMVIEAETTKSQASVQTTIVSLANGQKSPSVEPQNTSSHQKLSEQLFSIDQQSISKLKMQLFENVGKAFGIDVDEYIHFEDFAKDVELKYREILRDYGPVAIYAIERELGLDELGLSLRDVIDSMKNPDENDDVTKALEEKYNIEPNSDEASSYSKIWF